MSDDDDGRLRAYLDGELAPEARVELEQELASSSGARRRLSEVTALDEELARLLTIDAPEIDPETAWARSTIPREQRPRSFAWVLALAAAVVLAVGLGVWRSRVHTPIADELVATQRETIAIGTRAKAVAEAGSALSWKIDEHGDARVRQTAGAVFYRVDAGDAFVVETPAGRVTVLGTCFTVEIRPMSKTLGHIGSAIGGAALASAVLLTVHEGKVALANDRGELEVAAGQSARVFAEGGAPEIVERDAATGIAASKPLGPSAYAALVRESSQQRQRLRALEAELAARDAAKAKGETATKSAAPVSAHEQAESCAIHGFCDGRLWSDPTPEDLRELAKCGRLLYDTPEFVVGGDPYPRAALVEAAGLSEADAERYATIANAFNDDMRRRLVGLAGELDLPDALVERMSMPQLFALVDAVVPDDLRTPTLRAVANERAGLATPPTEQSAGERALRLQFDVGNAFEERLARELGPEVAHELRRTDGGWASKTSLGGDCEGEIP